MVGRCWPAGALPTPAGPACVHRWPSLRIKGLAWPREPRESLSFHRGPILAGPCPGHLPGDGSGRGGRGAGASQGGPGRAGPLGSAGTWGPISSAPSVDIGGPGQGVGRSPHGSAEEAAGNSRLRGAMLAVAGGGELGGWSAVGPGGTGAFVIRRVDGTQILSLGGSWDPSRHVGSAGLE